MDTTTIKRSPIVLIRTLVVIEFCAAAFYYIATSFDEYKLALYSTTFLSHLFSYDALKILFLALAQFCITVYGFLRWYYESYSIKPGSISHRNGVFLKRETIVPLERDMKATNRSGPIGKLFHCGIIVIKNSQGSRVVTLRDISHSKTLVKTIEHAIKPTIDRHEIPDVNRLLENGEHESLEFKSSMRFDHKTNKMNRELEKMVIKTIAAFLNSQGGYMVLGVDDARTPLGLEADYQTLPRKNSDGFEQHFTNVFNSMIGPEFRHFVKLWFHKTGDKEICVASVIPSTRPAYVRHDNQEHFYIRTGNITTPLKLSSAEKYTRSRWPAEES